MNQVAETKQPIPEFSAVQSPQVFQVWQQLLPMIERAFQHGQGDMTTPFHMRMAIMRGDMQMWCIQEGGAIIACIVLSVRTTDTMQKLFVELAAGEDIEDWIEPLERLLQRFKNSVGADCVEASCRLGLAKLLADRGWRKKAIIMEMGDIK